jgi:hypothetical protein
MQAWNNDNALTLFLQLHDIEVLEDGSWQAGPFTIRWTAAGPVVTVTLQQSSLEEWKNLGRKWAEEDELVDGAAGSD